jgi:hypothetical protein
MVAYLAWSSYIDQVRILPNLVDVQRLRVLFSVLNRKSGLSIRNGVLLYRSSSVP